MTMRAVAALLLALLIAACVWSFAAARAHGWWFPPAVSTYGHAIDAMFAWILGIVAFFLVLTLALLVACVLWFGPERKPRFVHGNLKLELAWTLVPGTILVALAFAQLSTWNQLHASAAPDEKPLVEVWASQFEWRFRYAGADGRFGTADDFEEPYELVVPVDERVVLALRSRDVIHSLFVPSFRLKQDILPGSTLRAWFQVEKAGSYDLMCTQLCGWGHYKMAGRVRAVPRTEFDAWIAREQRGLMSNGQEDQR